MVPKSVVCCLSPKKMNASVVMAVKNANVGEIGDLQLHKSFNICVEVLSVADEETVGANLRKQDVVVADSTGSARLVLWEKEIGTMRVGDCYSVESVTVREFHGERYFSSQKQRTVFRDADPVKVFRRRRCHCLLLEILLWKRVCKLLVLVAWRGTVGFLNAAGSCVLMTKGLLSAQNVVLHRVVRQLNHVYWRL